MTKAGEINSISWRRFRECIQQKDKADKGHPASPIHEDENFQKVECSFIFAVRATLTACPKRIFMKSAWIILCVAAAGYGVESETSQETAKLEPNVVSDPIADSEPVLSSDVSELPEAGESRETTVSELPPSEKSPEVVVLEENMLAPALREEPPQVAVLDPTSIRSSVVPVELPPPPVVAPYKSPFWAVSLSALMPGLGHVYLGDAKTARGLIGGTCLGAGLIAMPSRTPWTEIAGFMAIETSWMYGMYAAYRDTRKSNGEGEYVYQMPTDDLADLSLAPVRWSVLKKPEVWGGILGALGVACGVAYFAGEFKDAHVSLSVGEELGLPFIAFPIAISEESFFRGFLQSSLSETLSPWAGITLSSLLFGAAHIPNALVLSSRDQRSYYAFSLPLITAMGAYFGWLTYKNRSLKESVAVHAWYDFTLLALTVVASQAAVVKRPAFAISIPY